MLFNKVSVPKTSKFKTYIQTYGFQDLRCMLYHLSFSQVSSKWLRQDSNPQPLSLFISIQIFRSSGQMIELCCENVFPWHTDYFFLVSHTWTNRCSEIALKSREKVQYLHFKQFHDKNMIKTKSYVTKDFIEFFFFFFWNFRLC